MDKFMILIGLIILAVIIGIIAGFIIGPVFLERTFLTDFLGITTPPAPDNVISAVSKTDETDTSDNNIDTRSGDESEPQAIVPNYPIVGKWEVSELIEIDPYNMDEIGAFIEFFADKTGIEHHSEEPKQREFTWETESGRLTITPIDPSYRIRTYEYEIDENQLIIFFNRNRTSYFEATKVS